MLSKAPTFYMCSFRFSLPLNRSRCCSGDVASQWNPTRDDTLRSPYASRHATSSAVFLPRTTCALGACHPAAKGDVTFSHDAPLCDNILREALYIFTPMGSVFGHCHLRAKGDTAFSHNAPLYDDTLIETLCIFTPIRFVSGRCHPTIKGNVAFSCDASLRDDTLRKALCVLIPMGSASGQSPTHFRAMGNPLFFLQVATVDPLNPQIFQYGLTLIRCDTYSIPRGAAPLQLWPTTLISRTPRFIYHLCLGSFVS